MNPTGLLWRGLAMGAGTEYRIRSLEGWEQRPPSRYTKTARAQGHGAHRSRVLADERIVTVEGWCWSADQRDELLHELQAAASFGDGDEPEPLVVTAAGRTLTAGGQLLEAAPSLLRGEWGVGRFGWLLQWRCPDPLRYADPVTVSTGLPEGGGGLVYPLVYPLDYGTLGATGQLTLTNPGTASAPILFAVRGPLPAGFELSAAGQQLTYAAPVPAGQVIAIDTDTGGVLVEGTASRRGNLSRADWMRVPARGALTVQFTSLGGTFDPAAEASATVAGAYW